MVTLELDNVMTLHLRILNWTLVFILRLRFPPGKSPVNTLILQEVLEDVWNAPYAQILVQQVWKKKNK